MFEIKPTNRFAGTLRQIKFTPLVKITPEMLARFRERRRQKSSPLDLAPIAATETPVSLTEPVVDLAIPTNKAAALLGVSPETMKKWRQRGTGPVFSKYPDGTVRYRLSEVVKFFNDCAQKK